MDKKILVIDDDPLVLKTVRNVLKVQGFSEVRQASEVAEALEIVKNEEFDLVISDIRMPGMNGVEGAREISRLLKNETRQDLPIIFITGYAELSQELAAEKLGEVMMKPFDLDHLVVTIREYL